MPLVAIRPPTPGPANLQAQPATQPAHSASPANRTTQPGGTGLAQKCCPKVLPKSAAQNCCPKVLPKSAAQIAAQKCCPKVLPKSAAQKCCPKVLPKSAAQSAAQMVAKCTKSAAKKCYPKVLPKSFWKATWEQPGTTMDHFRGNSGAPWIILNSFGTPGMPLGAPLGYQPPN